ncbi:unknown protein [Seminavis robusta]|uniref:SAP domain-containing protein n=1 Tax=Seminavis robusta TaxID=568900 RepID=A0A9N8EJ30_9STRA|nr:unknown protein [Seminavis robusta]|eukprot:Sro1182_g249940.1 n/a (259) ;mRNA; f:15631-16407
MAHQAAAAAATAADPASKEDEEWGKSKAKKLLKDDIISGRVTDEMKPSEVKAMRPEFAKWKKERFASNLGTLKEGIARDFGRMLRDCEFYGIDIAIVKEMRKKEGKVPFYRSAAKPLLMQDIDDEVHLTEIEERMISPKEIYYSRTEYQRYATLDEFRGYLYQEIKKREKIEVKIRYGKKKLRGRAGEATPALIELIGNVEKRNEEKLEQKRAWKLDETEAKYTKMTVKELKEELRNRGLKLSGKKSDLIERLLAMES